MFIKDYYLALTIKQYLPYPVGCQKLTASGLFIERICRHDEHSTTFMTAPITLSLFLAQTVLPKERIKLNKHLKIRSKKMSAGPP